MTDNQTDQRLEAIESKQAFQEDAIEVLNEVIIKQQKEIDKLHAKIAHLDALLQQPDEGAVGDISKEPPPPHY
jgi:SlyX protein